MISLHTSALSDIDPQHGLSKQEIQAVSDRLPKYLQNIHIRKQGFYTDEVLQNEALVSEIENFTHSVQGKYDHIVLLGIGGSSLGPIALREALGFSLDSGKARMKHPQLLVLDNIDPDFLAETEAKINLKRTLFLVVSKSGRTAETASQYFYFSQKITKANLNMRDHFVFITDPEKGVLRKESKEKNIHTFPIPPDVGGRFSVLTAVGLLPAALMGINIRGLLKGGREMRELFLSEDIEKNTPFKLASIQHLLLQKEKSMNVMYSYSHKLFRMADWFRQLLAESTGKRYSEKGEEIFTGITPIASLGATDQHSQNQLYFEGPNDKLFLFLETESFDHILSIPAPDTEDFSYLRGTDFGALLRLEKQGTEEALTKVNRPHITIKMKKISEENIGAFFLLLEGATAFLGEFLDINAFDQPGVELSKDITKELLEK